ncbi:MAG: methionine--tRNA ligase [Anaerolineae bacterium]|nr:methionine--tRNA ligase [Anaerolineae bacterium]
MSKPFYITTPIYYVNDEPHLGHAYTTVLADVLARYARLRGDACFFLTGTDEHGQKVQNAAQEREITPQAQADEMVVRFQDAWDKLHIVYDDFIRTTEPRHVHVVETILQLLWDKGEIYKGEYEGWYCVPDERFWTEKDLVEGTCPECGRAVERLVEANYFFRMSQYQEWLIDTITANPSFIQPEHRRNEVLGYLRRPLGDLCISRPSSRLQWGIPLPFDHDYVCYVWFDALINYVTAAGYLADDTRFEELWPSVIHLIGKDILTTHAVYWSTMLQAIGLPQPQAIFAHGWWISDGLKMSKSRGNVVKPLDLAEVYGVDAFRYFLMRDMTPGRDANFDQERIGRRYQADLANDLGNLLHRVVNMIGRYNEGRIPEPGGLAERECAVQARCLALVTDALDRVNALAVNDALAEVMAVVGEINRYLEQTEPWKLAKHQSTDDACRARVAAILYAAAEALRLCSVLLSPVLPERMAELWRRLGWQPPAALHQALGWGNLQPGMPVVAGPPLFPKVDC